MTQKQAKIALVLGASSDIGMEILRQLNDGETLLIAHCFNRRDKLQDLRRQMAARLKIVGCDLSTDIGVADLIAQVKETGWVPNQIIHLPASKFRFTRFKDEAWASFQKDLDLQLKSIIRISQEYLPAMAKNRSGRIVFMLSSVCVGVPPKALSSYTVTKYALFGLMKSLAAEYAEKGITVNAVSPSMVETGFLSEIPEKMIEIIAANQPLKRNVTVQEIAPLVRFILSDDAQYITGNNFSVTGGAVF